jgi:hypothetical protein
LIAIIFGLAPVLAIQGSTLGTSSKLKFLFLPAENSTDKVVALQFDVRPTNPAIKFGNAIAQIGDIRLVADGHLIDAQSGTHRFVVYNNLLQQIPSGDVEVVSVELDILDNSLLPQARIEITNPIIARDDAALSSGQIVTAPLLRLDTRGFAWVNRSFTLQVQAFDLLAGAIQQIGLNILLPGNSPQSVSVPPPGGSIPIMLSQTGSHTLQLEATTASGITAHMQSTLQVAGGGSFTTYEAFANAFLSHLDPALRTPTANPDGDPFSNLFEYLFSGDPLQPNSAQYRVDHFTNNNGQVFLRLRFQKPSTFPLPWFVENSRELAVWSPNEHTVQNLPNAFQEVTSILPLTPQLPSGSLQVSIRETAAP